MARKFPVDVAVSPRDWQTDDDLRILQKAIEIRRDAKRMARVKALAKTRLGELEQLSGEADEVA